MHRESRCGSWAGGCKRGREDKRVALPVFEINGRTVVELEVWVAKDGFPVANAVLGKR